MFHYKSIPFSRFSLGIVLATVLVGCGKLSNIVELNFDQAPQALPKSAPFIGLLPTAGTRTSGEFRVEVGIGSQVSTAAQTSGSFKFYGGIQGQAVSR